MSVNFVIERAKLSRAPLQLTAGSLLLFAACTAFGPTAGGPTASYDATRRLVRIDSDLNGDGAIDHRAYMDGNKPLRAEIDQDADARVDRWEYFDRGARLLLVGTSSAADGVEDTWTGGANAIGERRVDLSLVRDRGIDRREFFLDAALIRAEVDTNADGRIDRWETFDAGKVAQVALDTTLAGDRPDRRLTYDRDGRFRYIEIDPDRDGQWEQLR